MAIKIQITKEQKEKIISIVDVYKEQLRYVLDYSDSGDHYFIHEWLEEFPCTGLEDENGKMIFEGDIVDCFDVDKYNILRGYTSSVDWFDYGFCVSSSTEQKYDTPLACLDASIDWVFSFCEIEIIGNIHDNPALLEDK